MQLIVTANVANLLLARATDRRCEMAIGLAAGASRGRLIRPLLTESLLLSCVGAMLGMIVATWTIDSLTLLLPDEIAAQSPLKFQLDGITLGVSAPVVWTQDKG